MGSVRHIAIAGAGFSGAVLAQKLAEHGGYDITVFDRRDHVAGNCHTVRDPETQVMIHEYGPHIFHTSREDVWNYINQFAKFGSYTNRVKAVTARGMFTLPINLLTINQFFNKSFSPDEAQAFIKTIGDSSIGTARSFEDQALKFLGRDMYKNFFYGYTKKQWGVEPRDLPASILQRLPVRFNYDDNYYNSKYQGIPVEGYTTIIEKLLDHPRIHVRLKEDFKVEMKSEFDHVFYAGPLDGYFGYSEGRLQYRSLVFERQKSRGDFQGNAVINYCQEDVPFTRISEHKHFAPWEDHEGTVIFKEYSKATESGDTPYYPMRLTADKEILAKYVSKVADEKNVTFIGRLGTYRYLDMHVVIGESLDLAGLLRTQSSIHEWPKFSAPPL